jgi:hypothetical protein
MEYKTYLFTYSFDGANWQLPIKAKTPEEARARLNRVLYAEYTGELIASISTPTNVLPRMASFFYRLLCLGQ